MVKHKEIPAATVVANRDKKSAIRREKLHDIEYIVVPMIMLTEGVHRGSAGSFRYDKKVLRKRPNAWNHKPVVVYHPVDKKGEPTTVDNPSVMEAAQVGFVLNARYDPTDKSRAKLKAEAWLDEKRLKKVDERILNALDKEQTVELSTGIHAIADTEGGVLNNRKYRASVVDYTPDHLALLPDQKGACSVKDGCGCLRTNSAGEKEDWEPPKKKKLRWDPAVKEIANSEGLSFEEISSQLRSLLAAEYGEKGKSWYGYPCSVYPTSVIWCDQKGVYWENSYSMKGGTVKITGEAVKVERKVEFKPVSNSKEKAMAFDAKAHVDKLIGNGYEEEDRADLLKISPKVLAKIAPVVIANAGDGDDDDDDDDEVPVVKKKKKIVVKQPVVNEEEDEEEDIPVLKVNKKKEKPTKILMKDLPEEAQTLIKKAQIIVNRDEKVTAKKKEALVKTLMANENNEFTEEFLNLKEVEELEGLVKLSGGVSESEGTSVPMFQGNTGGYVNNSSKVVGRGIMALGIRDCLAVGNAEDN